MKRFFSISYSDNAVSFAALVLRLAMGSMMLPYGFSKLVNFTVLSQKFSDPFHIGHTLSLCLVIFAELLCPALIILGLLTRLACIPLVISLTVALSIAHHWQLFGAGERAGLFLAGFLAILCIGPGKLSLDRMVG
ncbi:MAG TPA: DoxX family protein [Chitinophagaceae bacterium]|nr:DoxX family protein [Chitinophagaceae bacterium]